MRTHRGGSRKLWQWPSMRLQSEIMTPLGKKEHRALRSLIHLLRTVDCGLPADRQSFPLQPGVQALSAYSPHTAHSHVPASGPGRAAPSRNAVSTLCSCMWSLVPCLSAVSLFARLVTKPQVLTGPRGWRPDSVPTAFSPFTGLCGKL